MSIRSVSTAFVAVLSLAPGVVQAQRWTRPIRRFVDHYYGIEIGITGGPNWTTAADAGSVDGRFRGSLGGFASFPVADPIRIRTELLVTGTQIGVVEPLIPPCAPNVLCDPVASRVISSLTWLQLPLLLEAHWHHAMGEVSPRLFAGPFVAVRLACSVIEPILTSPPTPQTEDQGKTVTPCALRSSTSGYNNGDAGFVAGAGLAIGGFGLNARWTRSLVPLAPTGSSAGQLAGAKQSTLSVFVDLGTRLHR